MFKFNHIYYSFFTTIIRGGFITMRHIQMTIVCCICSMLLFFTFQFKQPDMGQFTSTAFVSDYSILELLPVYVDDSSSGNGN